MGSYGVQSLGLRAPILRRGDDLLTIAVITVIEAIPSVRDGDILAITESVVARTQGNYASIDEIASDLLDKYGETHLGIVFPIMSRNRFSFCLRAAARAFPKITILLSYPSDEQGNPIISKDLLREKGINPWSDTFEEEGFREIFGPLKHPFTGIDYVSYYRELVEGEGSRCEILFANDPTYILEHTKDVLVSNVHNRAGTKAVLEQAGAKTVFGLEDILSTPSSSRGYHKRYGLLGANASGPEEVNLFPRECQTLVESIQEEILHRTGKRIEVLIFGDGAFKDPVGGIWELADPVVSPAFTKGLEGTPSELKLKYLVDGEFSDLEGEDLSLALKDRTTQEEKGLGTTPRQITDLVGTLADLTSGSGGKGTPFVYIRGYFDSYPF